MSTSYLKQGFKNGQVLKAEHLIKMEEGIQTPIDWSEITNKTHYVSSEAQEITWDGNTDGLTSVDLFGNGSSYCYLVSDHIPSNESLQKSQFTFTEVNDGVATTTVYDVASTFGDIVSTGLATEDVVLLEGVLITRTDNFTNGTITVPTAGVYFARHYTDDSNYYYVSNLTVPEEVKQLDQKYVPNADMSVNDPNGDGYIKNRTHYTKRDAINITFDGPTDDTIKATKTLLDETWSGAAELEYAEYCLLTDAVMSDEELKASSITAIQQFPGSETQTGTIALEEVWDYAKTADNYTDITYIIAVREDNVEITYDDDGSPTYSVTFPKAGVYTMFLSATETDEETGETSTLMLGVTNFSSPWTGKKLDPVYMPYGYGITKGTGLNSEIFNVDETGNTHDNIAAGNYSHVEGGGNEVYGAVSHAEGSSNVIMGDCSHAEGSRNKVNGNYSHAEGEITAALGSNSHTEGKGVAAVGYGSHAEGVGYYHDSLGISGDAGATTYNHTNYAFYGKPGDIIYYEGNWATVTSVDPETDSFTVDRTLCEDHYVGNWSSDPKAVAYYSGYASGDYAHAEGCHNIASGCASHAEGISTIASGQYQHVQGRYNKKDAENKYAHIVGNGAADTARFNAHTVDWNGNGWFSNNIYVGSSGQDDPDALRMFDVVETVVLDSTNVSYKGNDTGVANVTISTEFDLIPGEVYEVMYNSAKYYWIAKEITTDTTRTVYLGRDDSSTEPFTIKIITDLSTGTVSRIFTKYDIHTSTTITAGASITIKTVKRMLNDAIMSTHYTEKDAIEITWDGDTTDLDSASFNDSITYYRVSDLVLSAEDLERCDFDFCFNITNSAPFPITLVNHNRDVQINVSTEGDVTCLYETTSNMSSTPCILVCPTDGAAIGDMTLPSKGVYVIGITLDSSITYLQEYVSRIYVPRKVKQLDRDFIPNVDMSINDEYAPGFVKNRTHYTEFEPKEITWDGDITDLETVVVGGMTLYKISDEVMTNDEVFASNFTGTTCIDGEVTEETISFSETFGNSGILAAYAYGFMTDEYAFPFLGASSGSVLAVIRSDNCTANILSPIGGEVITATFPKAGTYFYRSYTDESNYKYISKLSLAWAGKKLDEKYIPDSIARIGSSEVVLDETTFTSEANSSGSAYFAPSSLMVTLADNNNTEYVLTYDNVEYVCTSSVMAVEGGTIYGFTVKNENGDTVLTLTTDNNTSTLILCAQDTEPTEHTISIKKITSKKTVYTVEEVNTLIAELRAEIESLKAQLNGTTTE